MKPTINATIILLFGMIICIHGYSQSTCGSLCTNPGFESGTGFWQFTTGTACQSPTSEPCNLITGLDPVQHVLQTSGGFDPIVGGTILPLVAPGGGGRSMRIGDGAINGAKAARASISYSVTPATANFTYQYAVVLQEPQGNGNPHTDAQRPYFSINVYDEFGNQISCGDLFVLAKSPFTNFKETKFNSKIWYRGWTKAVINLAAYVGKCVRIEFTATDCTLTDHFGYAYIDASCDPLDLIISSSNACGGYTLTGPANAIDYKWTNITVGGKTGIDGPDNTQTINVNRAGTYQVMMSSPLGPNCATTLNITIDSVKSNIVNFTPKQGCSSITTQFTDQSTPGGTITAWSWDFNGDGVIDKTSKNPSFNYPAGGSYPVTLTIKVGSCTASKTQTVTVSLPTLPVIDPAGPFCLASSPVNLNASIPGGTWSGKGITNPATGAYDPSLASPGDNNIIYTTAASCPGIDTVVIHINAPFSDTGPNLTLCSGTTATLGIAPTAGNDYSWSPPTGLSSTTVSDPTLTLLNNGTTSSSIVYFLTTTVASTGCYSYDSVVVTVNPPPLINAGVNQTICSNLSVQLAGSIAGSATSATWSGGTGTYSPNNTTLNSVYTPSAAEKTAGNASLTLTTNDPAGPCSSANDQMQITINPIPTITVGSDKTICVGNSTTLTATIGGSATGGTWNGGTGTYSPNRTTPNITYTPSAAEESAGYATLTFTSNDPAGPCGASSGQVKIYINPKPVAFAGLDKALCKGSTVQLAGTVSGNLTTATWSGGAGTFTPDNKTLNATYLPAANELSAGTITLTLTTDAFGACPISSDQVTIAINPIATANAGTDQLICVDKLSTVGNSVNLSGTFGGAATSGIWSGGQGSFSPSNTSPNAVYMLNESEMSGSSINLAFTSNDPAGPCPAVNDQMTIVINQTPKVNVGIDQTVCAGTTATLSGIVSGSFSSVTWSGGNGTFNPDNKSINCIYTLSPAEITAGSVSLTLTTNDPPGPCPAASDQLQIFVNPVAQADAGLDKIICFGETVNLNVTISGAATSGTWNGGQGTYSPNNATPNAIYTPSNSEKTTGVANLVFTTNDPPGPCSAVSDVFTIKINQLAIANAGKTIPVCYGDSVKLGGSIGGSANSGTWSGGAGRFTPNNTTLNAIYTPTLAEYDAGSVTLTLTSNDPLGPCSAVSSTVALTFFPVPTVDFNVDSRSGCSIHCSNFSDISTVIGNASIVAWNWDFGDGGTSKLQTPKHCFSSAGDYGVSLKVTDSNGCSTTRTKDSSIVVFKLPVANFRATPNPASQINPEVSFYDMSSRDVNYWFWSFGDGETLGTKEPNPAHIYPSEAIGSYEPMLIVKNVNLCTDTARMKDKINVGPEFSFFIPNAFTPENSTGLNDNFGGVGTGISMYDIWIYDRWGNIVFHSNDINNKWDGKALELTEFYGNNKGKRSAQRDVFVWRVVLTDVFGNLHNYDGTVTLVR